MTTVRTVIGENGAVLHVIATPPGQLPPVAKRDLEQAWEAARAGAAGPPRLFRFAPAGTAPAGTAPAGTAPVELFLNDSDAAAWAAAVDAVADLGTPRGISICLRLLALVALMGRADWVRPWFVLRRGGAEIDGGLLQAAALAPLNEVGGFDETALRALLPQAAAREAE